MTEKPDRNLAIEIVRVTEAAALAAARWQGRGDKEAGDQAAVDAMRQVLETVEMDGTVIIGEGEKDEAPMLFNGEAVGTGSPPKVDIAVDPIDGTRLLAEGRPGSLAVMAAAPDGALFDPGHADPDPWIAKGRALFAARQSRLEDPAISREIGNLLGNDLGPMRVPSALPSPMARLSA